MTTSLKFYDVIYAGNYTKDTIITPDGIRYVDGGGMNYAAAAGHQLGIHAAVVTRLAEQDKHVVKDIESRGIDCYPIYSPSSTLMTLEYKTHEVDKRNLYVKGIAGTIKPEHLGGLEAHAIVVSPSLRGEVEPEFFEILRRNSKDILLSADVQGFVRVLKGEALVYEPWPDMERVVHNLDILKSDAVEAQYLTGETNIEKAALFFACLGAKEIVLTHSEGVLIHAEGKFHHYPWHSKSMEGRSGRGDTCVGSYVAKRLTLPPAEAGKWSAAATSLKMETLGVFNRSIAEVEELIAHYYVD
jgi:sugar/nucleoside kinase (ribokinase family)